MKFILKYGYVKGFHDYLEYECSWKQIQKEKTQLEKDGYYVKVYKFIEKGRIELEVKKK